MKRLFSRKRGFDARQPTLQPHVHPCIQPLERRTLLASTTGLAAAYFARDNATDFKFSRVDSTINFDWSSKIPASSLGGGGFSVRWAGQILTSFGGANTLYATTTGGIRIWVGNRLVINDPTQHAEHEAQGVINVAAGKKYGIRIDFTTNGDHPKVKLEWSNANLARQVIPANRLLPATLDSVSPAAPAHLHVVSGGSTSVKLAWDATKDTSVIAYHVFNGKNQIGTTSPGATSFVDTGLAPQTSYSVTVRAVDAGANLSGVARTAVVTAPQENQPPTVPDNLNVTGTTVDSISLEWSDSSDDGSVTGYKIYRNGSQVGDTNQTSYTDSGLAASTQYQYTVRAVDNSSVLSGASTVSATTTRSVPSSHDAFSTIDAADFNQDSGVTIGSDGIEDLDNGDWVKYSSVAFGSGTGAKSVTLSLALDASNRGGTIELRLDGTNGTLIGSHQIQPTGSWSAFEEQTLNVSNNGNAVTGTHDLYVLFKNRNDMGNLQSIVFSNQQLTRIMALGDSITAGWGNSPNYRYYLWQLLQQAGKSVDFVGSQIAGWSGGPPNFDFDQNHEGYAGIRADQIATQAAAWASANTPDIVLLHAGTNDMEQGQSFSSTITDLGNIIDALRSVNPDVIILVAQIIPIGNTTTNAAIDLLNAQIPLLVAAKDTVQSPLIVVDQNTGFGTSDLQDGIHPKDSGDQKMANNWYDALLPLLA